MTNNIRKLSTVYRLIVSLMILALNNACSDDRNEKVELSSKPLISVHGVTAETGEIQSWVFAEGTARSASREYLVFQNAGKITYIEPGLREGSVVEIGTLLASQDQRSLEADLIEAETSVDVAVAELGQAKTKSSLAEKTFKRFEMLLKQNSASEQEYDEAKAQYDNAMADVLRAQNNISAVNARLDQMQVRLEESELHAPISGMVAYLNIEKGYYFTPNIVRTDSEESALNTVPIVMIDTESFEIGVNVPVYDRDRVKVGQTVLIQTRQSQVQPSLALGEREEQAGLLKNRIGQTPPQDIDNPHFIRGSVYSVNPAVSPSGRSIQVSIRTNDRNLALKDGMYVTVWIATEHKENVVTAPIEAFLFRDNQPYVYVVDEETGIANLREVSLGLQGFYKREVVQGVTSGEWLVTEGRYQLSNNTLVRILQGNIPKTQENENTSGDG